MRHDSNNPVVLTPEELAAETARQLELGRMLCGQLPKGKRGNRIFKLEVHFHKNPGRVCSLASHFEYGSCARELVGYLEAEWERLVESGQAAPDRFMFHGIETLRKNCFKGDRTRNVLFSRREFYNALKLLRGLGIVSPRIKIGSHDGIILAPHAALCHREGNVCRFVGILQAYKAGVGVFDIRNAGAGEGVIWRP